MAQHDRHMATVRISIQNKNGTFYITSDDVPGLWLWGKDPEDLLASVVPALKALYEHNDGVVVDVKEADKGRTPAGSEGHISDTYEIFKIRTLQKHATV